MNWDFEVRGNHVHVTVFMNGANCGKLCFRHDEFEEIRRHCPWIRYCDHNKAMKDLDKAARGL